VVYVVTLTRPLWIRAYVSEARLGALRPGMPVTIRSDTPGMAAAHGHVGFISPAAEFTPKSVETAELRTSLVYRVRIIVDDDVRGLHQGMPVTVALGGA
jgi:HlyD family secretion protein